MFNDFKIQFFENNRTVIVGPLKSFMNQMIPDGLKVKLTIQQNNVTLNELVKTTRNGYVTFNLDANVYPKETYNIIISVAEISKTYPSKKLW